MIKKVIDKKGQVTLFVIFGILVVISIVLLFLLLPSPESSINPREDPQSFIRQCVANSLKQNLPIIQQHGGYFNPDSYLVYQDKKVAYHCYTDQKRIICQRNDALFKPRIEQEIKDRMNSDVEDCFNELTRAFRGYDVELGSTDFSIEILPSEIYAKTRKSVKISRNNELVNEFNNFDYRYNSPLFDFIKISNEILNHEVRCNCPEESCIADVADLRRQNLAYKITFFVGSGEQRVYTLEDYFDNVFKFAVKNCDKSP